MVEISNDDFDEMQELIETAVDMFEADKFDNDLEETLLHIRRILSWYKRF